VEQLPRTFEEIAEWDIRRPGWWRTADLAGALPKITQVVKARRSGTSNHESLWGSSGHHVPGQLRTGMGEPGR
jgi:hypothetical protein